MSIRILILCLTGATSCTILCIQAFGQPTTEIAVQPFWAISDSASYRLTYTNINTNGRNQKSDTAQIIHYFTAHHIESNQSRHVIRFSPDSLRHNSAYERRDDRSVLLAMFGLEVIAEFDANGQFLEVLNKEEIINQYIARVPQMPGMSKDQFKNTMSNDLGSIFFQSIIDHNYTLLLQQIGKNFDLNTPYIKDSPLLKSDGSSGGLIRKQSRLIYQDPLYKIMITEKHITDTNTQDVNNLKIQIGEIHADSEQTIMLTSQGQINSIQNIVLLQAPVINIMGIDPNELSIPSSSQIFITEIEILSN